VASTLKFYHRHVPGLADQPLGRLLDFVAATDPAPGGGSSAAVAAALGAALVEMVACLEAARDDSEVDQEVADRAATLRAEALELADRDMSSYAPVLEAQRLRADDPARPERLAAALAEASHVPLAIAENAAETAVLGAQVAAVCTRAVRGDVLAGVLVAEAAVAAAASLIEINLAGAGGPDLARARDARRRAQEAREDALATLPRSS
jgi:formiminotetrahydrofolate cyclodeaminase